MLKAWTYKAPIKSLCEYCVMTLSVIPILHLFKSVWIASHFDWFEDSTISS